MTKPTSTASAVVAYDPTGTSYDTHGQVLDHLPLDRTTHLALADAILHPDPDLDLPAADYDQISRQLSAHAALLTTAVRSLSDLLDPHDPKRLLTEIVLAEADRDLSHPPLPTLPSAQAHARPLRKLYERLDSLTLTRTPSGPS
ncbi:DUF6415 family natural product biosynthesis protein [Streptomyces acidiscabies]|uniref:DUF6415 family natural product biosynthesis protein n=1 Tax=Streptomyces acidiscabies TaxID=42234 RepID=UPI000E6901F9|nr:DUF6415 family natural product biosynthesis protein [Streptomyces acidiscabies]MBP5942579.1 restriction endonuclease [Streptomyces sp. LBUM 1476]MBP5942619.1 restriction endonuclease [Streptomyces sp. LBUM 1476]